MIHKAIFVEKVIITLLFIELTLFGFLFVFSSYAATPYIDGRTGEWKNTETANVAISDEPDSVVTETSIDKSKIDKSDYSNPYYDIITNLSAQDHDDLVRTLNIESGGEPLIGMVACARVICNRIMLEEYPNTMHGVLSQPHQFTGYRKRATATPGEKEEKALQYLIEGKDLPLDERYRFFNAHDCEGIDKIKIGKQMFGR